MNTNDDLKLQYQNLINEQRVLQERFRESAIKLFNNTFETFFELNPGINAVIWEQFTPYFNDGDECVFSVRSPTFTNAIEEEDLNNIAYGEYDGENKTIWTSDELKYTLESDSEYYVETKNKILSGPNIDLDSCDLIRDMLDSDEFSDVLKATFGDHTRVIATREGFKEEECEHD